MCYSINSKVIHNMTHYCQFLGIYRFSSSVATIENAPLEYSMQNKNVEHYPEANKLLSRRTTILLLKYDFRLPNGQAQQLILFALLIAFLSAH